MRTCGLMLVAALGLACLALIPSGAFAFGPAQVPSGPESSMVIEVQAAPGALLNPQRDCQTIRTCNFKKNGSYRGCLSSYSCRVCRFVSAPCQVRGGERKCQVMRCDWGA